MKDCKHTDKAEYDFKQWPELLRVIHEGDYGGDFIYRLFVDKFVSMEFNGKDDLHDNIATTSFIAGLRIGYSIAYYIALPFEKFKKEAETAGIEELDSLRKYLKKLEDSRDARERSY